MIQTDTVRIGSPDTSHTTSMYEHFGIARRENIPMLVHLTETFLLAFPKIMRRRDKRDIFIKFLIIDIIIK